VIGRIFKLAFAAAVDSGYSRFGGNCGNVKPAFSAAE